MSESPIDRNLLFGILALQNNFISRESLLAAFALWIVEKQQALGMILIEQGRLTQSQYDLLVALTDQHILQHGNDPEQSLAVVSSVGSIREQLMHLGDSQLCSLLSILPEPAIDPQSTEYFSPDQSRKAGERFRVLRPHAKGGLGEVHVAQDLELRREVALKEIQAKYADHPDSRSRFVLEAEITGGLEHPGIVPVYGLGQYADGRPYYAMRFIRGDSLAKAIELFHKADAVPRDRGERAIELRKLLGRFIDVCEAIEYAHSRGILHRDLKPGNIMLGKYGETLVVDWGLAKLIERAGDAENSGETTLRPLSGSSNPTMMGSAVGTPAYMSPEQASGRLDELGVTSDVYSLGATLYCLLTGRAPIVGDGAGEILRKVQRGDFPRPSEVKTGVDATLQAICLKAMALTTSARYSSPKALANDVERWLADEPVSCYREPITVRTKRLIRRHQATAAGIVAALAVILFTSVIFLSIVTQHNQQLNAAKQKLDSANTELDERNQQLVQIGEQERSAREAAVENEKLAKAERDKAEESAAAALTAKNETEKTLARASFSLATVRWNENRVGEAVELLDRIPAKYRNFEWYLTRREFQGSYLTLYGHNDPSGGRIDCLKFSSDGTQIISVGTGGTIKIWNTSNGEELKSTVIKEGQDQLSKFVFNTDNSRIAAGTWEGEVQLWDATTGTQLRTFKEHTKNVRCVDFSPSEELMASGSEDQTVRLWNAGSGEVRTLGEHKYAVTCLRFSPDGRSLASAGGEMRLWNVSTGEVLFTFDSNVSEIAFSPNGTLIAATCTDNVVKLFDATSGKPLRTLRGHTDWVRCIEFSPDGTQLVSGSDDQTIKLWDLSNGTERRTLKGHTAPISCVRFSPDGTRLASGSEDQTVKLWYVANDFNPNNFALDADSGEFSPDGALLVTDGYKGTQLWDVVTGQEIRAIGNIKLSDCIGISFYNGTRIATASDDQTISLWDAATGKKLSLLKGHQDSIRELKFSQDGTHVASKSYDDTIKIWDASSSKELFTRKKLDSERLLATLESVAFSPDSSLIAVGGADHTIVLLDAQTGETQRSFHSKHGMTVKSVKFNPAGNRIAAIYEQDFGSNYFDSIHDSIKLWDVVTGEELMTLHDADSSEIEAMSFSPDGSRIVACTDNDVQLWDAATGERLRIFKGHTANVAGVTFNPDGTRIATGSSDHTVRLWDTETGEELLTLRAHTSGVSSVTFSPDGTRLASIGDDSVRIWDATPSDLCVLVGHTNTVIDVIISPDGSRIASAADDHTIKLWNMVTGAEISSLQENADFLTSMNFSPDSTRFLLETEGNTWVLWNPAMGEKLITLPGLMHRNNSMTFSPDGKRIVSSSDDSIVKLFDIATGEEATTLKDAGLVIYMAFSPDGTRIAIAGRDNTVRVLEASTGKLLQTLSGHSKSVTCVAYDPSGNRVASGSDDHTIKIWDTQSGAELLTIDGHSAGVTGVVFSPDCKHIVSTGNDFTTRFWNATTGDELRKGLRDFHSGERIVFSPDGSLIARRSGETVEIEQVASGEIQATISVARPLFSNVAFSPDSTHIAIGNSDHSIKIFNVDTGEEIKAINGHTAPVTTVAFSPKGTLFASASEDKTIKLWNLTTNAELQSFNAEMSFDGYLMFSPEGNQIAAKTAEGVKIWDSVTGKKIQSLKNVFFDPVSPDYQLFSPDGSRIAVREFEQTIKLWDPIDGTELKVLKQHSTDGFDVTFSPDSRWIALQSDYYFELYDAATSAMRWTSTRQATYCRPKFSPDAKILAAGIENTVKRWDVASGEELATLTGHSAPVEDIFFNPEGTLIASLSDDQSLKVWDASNHKEIRTIVGLEERVEEAVFSRDSSQLLYTSYTGKKRGWNLKTGEELTDTQIGSFDAIVEFKQGNVSQDSRWLAIPYDRQVRLVDLAYRRSPKQRELRQIYAAPRIGWHREQAKNNEKDKNWYAATFHRSCLLNFQPNNAWAFDDLHAAYDKLVGSNPTQTLLGNTIQLALIHSRGSEITPQEANEFNNKLWGLVSTPPTGNAQIVSEQHLQRMQELCIQHPQSAYLNTLGVAQYRATQYEPAIQSLLQSIEKSKEEKLAGPRPTDLAFLAMSHFKLGHKQQADSYRQQFTEAMKGLSVQPDEASYVKEVNQLFDGN
jgi:eukaryotic-like serine/threonine-protein kinase